MTALERLKVKIFADGADLDEIATLAKNPLIKGFTTNPTLMRKQGIADYESFGRALLKIVTDRPVSFEVFADDPVEMAEQAYAIAAWGRNVNVKIPVTTTHGVFVGPLIAKLSADGVAVNVTAVTTLDQVRRIAEVLAPGVAAIVSVFAGRVADTGRDPVPMMRDAVGALRALPKAELLWASPRELLNIFHADDVGCHIITVTNDILKKLPLIGKDLHEYSLETVRMFHSDAQKSGYSIAQRLRAAGE
jgi:transaldolase